MLPIKYATVTTEKFYSEEVKEGSQKKGSIIFDSSKKKNILEGVTFNYKRRVVSPRNWEHHEMILRDTCNFHVKAPQIVATAHLTSNCGGHRIVDY